MQIMKKKKPRLKKRTFLIGTKNDNANVLTVIRNKQTETSLKYFILNPGIK
jgi:hypothetical protein